MEPGGALHDDVLQEEIALMAELVVAATASDLALTLAQIDRLLGVDG